MKVVNKKEERVRVLVGKNVYGHGGIEKPIKVITLVDTTVDEVFDKITKCLESEK
jgi:hypothetical protein